MSSRGGIRPIARSLVRAPSFSLGVVLTLGLGIGAMAAAFSAAKGVLITPLPHEDGSRLVYLRQSASGAGEENSLFSVPEIQVYRERVESFEGVAEFSSFRMTALGLDRPRQMHAGIVTGNYFEVLGLGAVLGRVLGPEDEGETADPVAVLTVDYWQSAFGGSPDVVGTTMRMNGRTVTIVGVAEPHPPYPERTDIFVNLVVSPHHLSAAMVHGWTHRMTEVFARMVPGATAERAAAEVRAVSDQLHADRPEAYDETFGYAVRLTTLSDQLTHRARTVLLLLVATAGFVLLVAVSNIANLTLARSTRLAEELAVRASLGAGRGALRARLLAENLTLGVVGAALAVGVAWAALPPIAAYASRFSIRASEIEMEPWTVVVALVLAVGSAVLLSFVARIPADSGLDSLRRGSRGGVGRRVKRAQQSLVVAQVAASLVLVVGAGLLTRTLLNLQAIDSGVDASLVVAMDVPTVRNGRSSEEIRDDHMEMIAAIERRLEVERAALTNIVPFRKRSALLSFQPDFLLDRSAAPSGAPPQKAELRTISGGLFETLGIEVLDGRTFTHGDDATSPPVAVVNESFVRTYLDGRDPIGHTVAWTGGIVEFAGASGADRTIVGVVADIVDRERATEPDPTIFVPHLQEPWGSAIVVRGRGDPASLGAVAAEAIRGVEADQPVEGIASLDEARTQSFGNARLNAQLVGLLAALGLAIASLGVFAVLAFSVSQRTREMGIRMALGADRARVIRGVVREGLSMVAAGVALGALASLGLGGALEGLLYGVVPTDLTTLGVAALALIVTATLATLVPARRASSVEPARALASE